MNLELAGKVALVTGGSRGIGRATARGLAAEGARVAIAARESDALGDAAREIEGATGTRPLVIPCDCTDAAEVAAMVRAVTEELGGIDVLVNSIGAAKGGHFLELFLASARASFVTGTVVSVDGGATRCL